MLAAGAIVACAGAQQSASAPVSGTSASDWQGKSDSGLPNWVNRGSAAVDAESGRVFYGVGLAGGIKNPSLLRTTADNRARAEIAKLFEVFSASLMKDYMASSNTGGKETNEQAVEQAVKTMSSVSLEGTEIVDRYTAANGSLYALAALRLDTALKAIRDAKAAGIVKTYVQKVNTDDIFDKHSQAKAKAAPPVIVSAAEAGAPAPQSKPSTSSAASTKGGAQPAWVTGQDPRYPYEKFLCAVGFSPDRTAAENGAYAALSRIFVARVASVAKDFMGSYSKSGAPTLETQSSESLTQVSTEKVFTGVQIPEIWQSNDNTLYALACLDRAKASRDLREQIGTQDGKAKDAMGKADSGDKADRVRQLGRALDAILTHEALNGELRIVEVDGVGITGPYSDADVAAALETAVAALKIGVAANGPFASDFRAALVEGLTKRGYQVSDLDVGSAQSGLDVVVNATIRVEDIGAGSGAAAASHFARGVVQIELKNVASGKVVGQFNDSRKEGHRSFEEAQRRVVRQLGTKLVGEVGEKIDATMKGRT